MPIKSAAKKHLRSSRKRYLKNSAVKVQLRRAIKKAKEAMEKSGNTPKVQELIKKAIKTIDRAAQKKVIKKNNAARKKRRLFKKLRSKEKK